MALPGTAAEMLEVGIAETEIVVADACAGAGPRACLQVHAFPVVGPATPEAMRMAPRV